MAEAEQFRFDRLRVGFRSSESYLVNFSGIKGMSSMTPVETAPTMCMLKQCTANLQIGGLISQLRLCLWDVSLENCLLAICSCVISAETVQITHSLTHGITSSDKSVSIAKISVDVWN